MKIYKVSTQINGTITFTVKAKNKKLAQQQVDDLLKTTSVKEAIGKYQESLSVTTKIKENKELQR